MSASPVRDDPDFSLVQGGALYRLFRFLGVSGYGRRDVFRRIAVFFLVGWVPLVVLCFAEGTLMTGRVKIAFLQDFGAHARLLAAVPLFVIAEGLVDRWLRDVVGYIRCSGLVPDAARSSFDAAVLQVSHARDALVPELLLLIPVIIVFMVGPPLEMPGDVTNWKRAAATSGAGRHFTTAGWWYALVSLPVYQFLLLRWLWRFFIWGRFLWRLARLPLQLLPAHPDRSGGLGYLMVGHGTFSTVIFASSSGAAASLAEQIMFAGASLYDFQRLIVAYALLVVLVFLMPLSFFYPTLLKAKREGLSRYAALVDRHHRLFAAKWLNEKDGGEGESILGNPDASSLADINSGYETLRGMGLLLITPRLVVGFALAAILPMAPLVLTVIPLAELLRKAAQLLM